MRTVVSGTFSDLQVGFESRGYPLTSIRRKPDFAPPEDDLGPTTAIVLDGGDGMPTQRLSIRRIKQLSLTRLSAGAGARDTARELAWRRARCVTI